MSAADFQLWSLRGIVLRLSAMTARCAGLGFESLPLGSRRRSGLLVCSLVGRCHGQRVAEEDLDA